MCVLVWLTSKAKDVFHITLKHLEIKRFFNLKEETFYVTKGGLRLTRVNLSRH